MKRSIYKRGNFPLRTKKSEFCRHRNPNNNQKNDKAQKTQQDQISHKQKSSDLGGVERPEIWFCQCNSIRNTTPHPMGNRSCCILRRIAATSVSGTYALAAHISRVLMHVCISTGFFSCTPFHLAVTPRSRGRPRTAAAARRWAARWGHCGWTLEMLRYSGDAYGSFMWSNIKCWEWGYSGTYLAT